MKSLLFSLKQKLQNNFYFSPLVVFTIQEESMVPLLLPEETILINRLVSSKKGDIVVLKNPDKKSQQKYFIKQLVKEEKDKVYVLGLNKTKSIDSRDFGWIKKKDIIGKMIMKL